MNEFLDKPCVFFRQLVDLFIKNQHRWRRHLQLEEVLPGAPETGETGHPRLLGDRLDSVTT